jgi:threonine synthase
MSFVSRIECSICRRLHDPSRLLTVCEACGQMLIVRYDLDRVAREVTKDALLRRPPGMYRFRELLPLAAGEEPVTLGEGGTPLLRLRRLGAQLGINHLYVKDEGQNPTGTFKARGLGMAITKSRALGAKGFMIPSAGNAGGAAAVYAARAGLPVAVVVPRDTPDAAIAEAILAGAYVFTVEGSIATAGQVVARAAPSLGWFDLATLKEPYRLEGKKTMGLELAEQLGWAAPEWLIYPTGGGTGLIGIHKAYQELRELGWVTGSGPRLVVVQAEGCAPVVKAWTEKAHVTAPWENPVTHAAGLRVPSPFAGRQMLQALTESGGDALAVSERAIIEAQKFLARVEGIWTAPEAATALAALFRMRDERRVEREARVVLLLTGAGIKNAPPEVPPPIALQGDPDTATDQIRRVVRSA